MAGEIGNENAEVLIRELLGGDGHDFFVREETVEQDNGADGRTGTRFVNIGGHVAAAGRGEHGLDFVRISASEKDADDAQQDANYGSKY